MPPRPAGRPGSTGPDAPRGSPTASRDPRPDHPGQEQRRGGGADVSQPQHDQVLHPLRLPQDRREEPHPGRPLGCRHGFRPTTTASTTGGRTLTTSSDGGGTPADGRAIAARGSEVGEQEREEEAECGRECVERASVFEDFRHEGARQCSSWAALGPADRPARPRVPEPSGSGPRVAFRAHDHLGGIRRSGWRGSRPEYAARE